MADELLIAFVEALRGRDAHDDFFLARQPVQQDVVRSQERLKERALLPGADATEFAAKVRLQWPVFPTACKAGVPRAREIKRQLERLRQGLELLQPVLFGFLFLGAVLETCLLASIIDVAQSGRKLARCAAALCRIDFAHLVEQNPERSTITDQMVRGEKQDVVLRL